MLHLAVVLLVAQSAFAAPSVLVETYGFNEIAPLTDNGRTVSSYVTSGTFDTYDGGELTVYDMNLEQIINDLANQGDSKTQALAISQTLAVLGELATGLAGDVCDAAFVIDTYVNSLAAGYSASYVAPAVSSYIQRLAYNIDNIVTLANNPDALRYVSAPKAGCNGGGRVYQFEAAWNAIVASANPYSTALVTEEKCSAKRMYYSINVRTNNVAAALTAASIDPVVAAVEKAIVPLSNFLKEIVVGNDCSQAAATAKWALVQASA